MLFAPREGSSVEPGTLKSEAGSERGTMSALAEFRARKTHRAIEPKTGRNTVVMRERGGGRVTGRRSMKIRNTIIQVKSRSPTRLLTQKSLPLSWKALQN